MSEWDELDKKIQKINDELKEAKRQQLQRLTKEFLQKLEKVKP